MINGVLKRERIAWTFTELPCTFEGRSIVPDIAIFTWENIPRDQNGEIADNFYGSLGIGRKTVAYYTIPTWTVTQKSLASKGSGQLAP